MDITKNRIGFKAAILTMSFVQMGTNGIAAVLADIASSFPEAPASVIQFLMTCPSIFVVVTSFGSAWLSRLMARKKLAVTGLMMVCASGLGAVVFHGSLILLYIWAALMGVGIGLVIPIAYAMISDYFEGDERTALMGLQSSAANMGSMMMTFLGGFLAAVSWHLDYLVYFLAVPGIILTVLFMPGKEAGKQESAGKVKLPCRFWIFGCFNCVFMLLFYMGPTNLAMLVAERRLGDATVAGIAATCLLLGGTLVGIFFGSISKKLGIYAIPFGFWVEAAGFLLLYIAGSRIALFAGSFVAGMGVSITLPQCMMQLTQSEDPRLNTLASAFGLSSGNLGTFAAPVITILAAVVTGQDTAQGRFLFCFVLEIAAGIACLIVCRGLQRRMGKEDMV